MRRRTAPLFLVLAIAAPLGAQSPDSTPTRLDAIVVTADRREQRLKDVTVQTELITRQEIEATGAADAAAVLTHRIGMEIDGGVPAGAGVLLQGLGSQRVLILLDGKPLTGRVNGNLDLSRIPASAIERIEVVKGPMSTLYGSSAMGGVINIITRGPPSTGSTMQGSVVAGTQGRRDISLGVGRSRGPLGLTVDGGYRTEDVAPGLPDSSGGYSRRWHLAPGAVWQVSPTVRLTGSALAVGERQRYPFGQLYNFADNTQWAAQAGLVWRRGTGQWEPALSLSRFDHLSRFSTQPVPVSDSGQRDVQELAQAEIAYHGLLGGALVGSGVVLTREALTSDRIDGHHRVVHSGEPYAEVTWIAGPVRITPGVRLSVSEQWGTAFTPRLALLYRPVEPLGIRAGVGRGYRAPDFKELYLNFANPAAGYAVVGNPALRPESSTNYSLGAEWSGRDLYLRVNSFYNRFTNFIETGEPDVTGTYTYENVAGGRTAGVEFEGGTTFGRARVDAGYGYLSTRDDSTGTPLLGRAPHTARLGIDSPLPLGFQGSAAAVYTGQTPVRRAPDGSISRERPAYTRIDLHLERGLPWSLTLTLGVDDLLDARAGQDWPGYTGRRVFFGARWSGSLAGSRPAL